MAGIAGESSLAAAQATFAAIFQDFFGMGVPGVSQEFSMIVPTDGLSLQIPLTTSFPRIRRWLGSKIFKNLRAFLQTINIETWEASVELKRLTVDADKSGVVDASLRSFLGAEVQAFDDMNITELLTNPVGYDSVTLLNDAHPFSSGTGDNLTTGALSLAELRSMDAQLRGILDEDGRPLNVRPDTLLVGESNRDTALEITGGDRPLFVDATGAEATSGVVTGVNIVNVRAGSHRVVVSPWITGAQWFLMDLTKPGLRPWVVAQKRAFQPVTDLQLDSGRRFDRDMYGFSLEGDYGIGAGLWQLIGGRIAA